MNPLADKENVSFEDIINEQLILMPIGEGYRYLFDDELAARNLYATPSIEIANTETILKLIKEANYVTMLPVFMVRNDIKKGILKKINVENCEMSQWSQLTYLKGKAITPLLQVFMDTLDELLPPVEK